MSTLKVFNTLSGKKEPFQTIQPGKVLMYACGPTVYDLSHLGHARMNLTFDMIQRYLRFSGYAVTFVRNITDVDDKIIHRAKELGVRAEQLSRRFTYTFWKDMYDLNGAAPEVEPRATEFIGQMINFTEELILRFLKNDEFPLEETLHSCISFSLDMPKKETFLIYSLIHYF